MAKNPLSLLVQWLASHLVIISVLLYLAVGVIWRGAIFGVEPVASVEQQLSEQPDAVSDEKVSDEPVFVPHIAVPKNHVIPPEPTEQLGEAHEKSDHAEPIESEPPLESDHSQPVRAASAADTFVEPVTPEEESQPVATEQEELVAEKPVTSPLVGDEKMVLIQGARRSYWNKDYESAVERYRLYLDKYPDDAAVYGELGNVYQMMGENQKALDVFYRAGQLHKAQGEESQTAEVIKFLKSQGDQRADELLN